jgi:hypothetical protein
MLDANIVAASCSAVYTTLKRAKMTKEWAAAGEETGEGFIQPERVHEQWYTDFSYLRIGGNFYYFVAVFDGFRRKILAWDYKPGRCRRSFRRRKNGIAEPSPGILRTTGASLSQRISRN